jgi:hypothetical protein
MTFSATSCWTSALKRSNAPNPANRDHIGGQLIPADGTVNTDRHRCSTSGAP